jgi:hypothetical protein
MLLKSIMQTNQKNDLTLNLYTSEAVHLHPTVYLAILMLRALKYIYNFSSLRVLNAVIYKKH